MSKNVFASSRIAGWETRLPNDFPMLDANAVFDCACKILTLELSSVDDRGSRMIGKHIRKNILPGYACYRALLDNGAQSAPAINFVEAELCRSTERMSRLCRGLSRKKYAYPLVVRILRLALRFAYPKEGWKIQNLCFSERFVSFEMTTCLYCEELKKRGALELCPAFCQTDHASYDPLSPSVVFKRKATLAQGSDVCDFCFERGQP